MGAGKCRSDPRGTDEREPLHGGGAEVAHRPKNSLHLHEGGGAAEPRRRASSRTHQETERRPGDSLQQGAAAVHAQAGSAAPRCDVERQDRNLHPPHPARTRCRPSGALPVARDSAHGADDGAPSRRVRQPAGHLPLALQRCRARGDLAEAALPEPLRHHPRCPLRRVPADAAAGPRHRRRRTRDVVQAAGSCSALPCPQRGRDDGGRRRGKGAARHCHALHGDLPQRIDGEIRTRGTHHALSGHRTARDTHCRRERPAPPQDDERPVFATTAGCHAPGAGRRQAGHPVPEPSRLCADDRV